MWDALWTDVHLATMTGPPVRDGALGIRGDRIVWAGPARELPGAPETLARAVHRGRGLWMTPGLIDCHTHLAFAGDRAGEFRQRLEGRSYAEIAAAGGGIHSTVRAVAAADEAALAAAMRPRLAALMAGGVTTVEIKSGYGLSPEDELKQLRAIRRVRDSAIGISATYLALHALPPAYKADRAGYLRQVCEVTLPAVAREGLADAVDAFCETIAFTAEETAHVFAATRALGLRVKLHADQLCDGGGAALAAAHGALSADHLEHTKADGVAALARAGTAAVLLPGAFYFLRETQLPPIAALRAAGVPIALATDCNPGTSPLLSPLLAMNMACTLFRLTPEEALAGFTVHAARALGRSDIGALAPGLQADLALWRVDDPAELAYWMGADLLAARVHAGVVTHRKDLA